MRRLMRELLGGKGGTDRNRTRSAAGVAGGSLVERGGGGADALVPLRVDELLVVQDPALARADGLQGQQGRRQAADPPLVALRGDEPEVPGRVGRLDPLEDFAVAGAALGEPRVGDPGLVAELRA